MNNSDVLIKARYHEFEPELFPTTYASTDVLNPTMYTLRTSKSVRGRLFVDMAGDPSVGVNIGANVGVGSAAAVYATVSHRIYLNAWVTGILPWESPHFFASAVVDPATDLMVNFTGESALFARLPPLRPCVVH